MKITTLTKRLGRTICTGDHNFLKIEAEVTAVFDEENDTYEAVDDVLFQRAKQSLNADMKRFREARKKDDGKKL